MKQKKTCSQTNPDNCKFFNSTVCAFIRADKKCKKSQKKNR